MLSTATARPLQASVSLCLARYGRGELRRALTMASLIAALGSLSCGSATPALRANEVGPSPVTQEPPAGGAKATEANAGEERAADEKVAQPPEGGKAEAVDQAFVELEALSKAFQEMGQKFRAAPPAEQVELRRKAMEMQRTGGALLGKVADAYRDFYAADPKAAFAHAKAGDIVFICFQRNRFAESAKYGAALLEAGRELPGLAVVTGTSLFAQGELEKAEQVLSTAQKAGGLDPRGTGLLEDVKKYKGFWAEEQKIREKEAAANDLPRVSMKTSRGDIVIELFENEAPGAVGNFVSLVEKKFYDGIAFHRVIPGFMAQGGDPNTKDDDPSNDGQGGPGYTIPCECAGDAARLHFSGSLSMAHAGKDTGGSQFFLTHLPTPHLNHMHTVFGRVIEGLDVVRAIEPQDKILEAKVLRKRDHVYAPPASAKKEG